jgi:carboxymethylenebutenolidase
MNREEVEIRTRDGVCRTSVFRPRGAGRWPAVIFYMDGLGIRPVLYDMCDRIARDGYVVLLPDMFYRAGPYDPLDPKAVFAMGDIRKALAHLFEATDNQRAAQDTAAFLDHLGTRADVLGTKVGTTGYCMGGAMSLTAAGTYPDRIAAAASFHGGNLATDAPMSPHLLAPRMKGFVYVAGADKDNSYPPEMHARLEQALSDAGVPHRCEIYPDALHGWTMADFPIYEPNAAERHFRELRMLFAQWLH